MTWTADRCYREGLAFFGAQVHGVRDWQAASPCNAWRALDVLGHVGTGTAFGTRLLQGEKPEWSPPSGAPGDAVRGDPAAWWDALAGPAADALDGVDLTQVVDSPMGPRSIAEGLTFPAIDLFVHGWDLARSAGRHVELPEGAIAFSRAALEDVPPAMLRSERVFGAEVPVPAGASDTDRFLAWTGRDPS